MSQVLEAHVGKISMKQAEFHIIVLSPEFLPWMSSQAGFPLTRTGALFRASRHGILIDQK